MSEKEHRRSAESYNTNETHSLNFWPTVNTLTESKHLEYPGKKLRGFFDSVILNRIKLL